jgi:hypothetical protein
LRFSQDSGFGATIEEIVKLLSSGELLPLIFGVEIQEMMVQHRDTFFPGICS